MPAQELVIGAAVEPDHRSEGWDFWWRSAAGDVVAVFHGFGGGGGGEVLARWVRAAMTEPDATSLADRARGPIERAHALALERVTPKGVAAATMACVAVRDDRVAIAHVGDARVYALTTGLELLTRDHTVACSDDPAFADLRGRGIDLLLRAVGVEERFAIDVCERVRAPAETLVLCTPGAYRELGDDLASVAALGRDAPRELLRRAPRSPAALALVLPSAAAYLIVLHAADPMLERRCYPLAERATIGSASDNDVVLRDDGVSRRHARIERRDGAWWLADHSTNGTFVNGTPMREGRLQLGDHVQIGRTVYRFDETTDVEIVEPWDTARIDALTGACSRTALLEQIAQTRDRPLALVRIDIIRFKLINDEHGFPAGDAMLRELAAVVRRHVRPGDVLARSGGDELAWLLPGVDRAGAALLAEQLRADLAAHAFDQPPVRGLNVRLGIAQASDAIRTSDDLFRAATPT